MRLATVALLVVTTLIASCAPADRRAGPITLTYASPYPPGHPFSRADIAWIGSVERASGGRLRIRPFWAGALLSSEQSMEEVRHGVADIGLITPIYARGGVHTQRVQAGFYGGVASLNDQVGVYKCLAARFPELDREMAGLHVLAVQGGNFPGVVTRTRTVNGLADLRGLRLRAPSENLEVLRRLGADPVNMPMGEVYSALAKGVIDGVIAPADTLKSLHFAEVAPHFSTLRVSRGAYPARAMSDRRWETLPPDIQRVLTAGEAVWEAALDREIRKAEQDGIDFGHGHGVAFASVAPADQKRFDVLYNENAARSARDLARFGPDGTPLFRAAQHLIVDTPPGRGIRCDAPPPSPSTAPAPGRPPLGRALS